MALNMTFLRSVVVSVCIVFIRILLLCLESAEVLKMIYGYFFLG